MRLVVKVFLGATLISMVSAFALVGFHFYARVAASQSGLFEQRLAKLQRSGICAELPRFGVSTHQATRERRNPADINIRLATDIGAQVVRFDIFWEYLEKDGRYKFEQIDALIRGLREKGKTVLLILTYGHPDHSDRAGDGGFLPPRTPEQYEAFYRYVRAVVNRYHGSDVVYQIWNEPNMMGWEPQKYGELLVGAARAIRAVDPQATIIAAGIANVKNRDSYLRDLVATTKLGQVDALAFHPYRQDAPEKSLADIAVFEGAALAENVPRALWLTEWGYSETWLVKAYSADKVRKRQAIMTARLMLTAAIAKAKALTIYDLIDDGLDITNGEHKFGIYDFEFEPKEAAGAFRTLAALMANCDQYRFEFDAGRKIIIATFKKSRGVTRVIWTYDSVRDREFCVELASSNASHLVDIFGNRIVFGSCGDESSAKINISEAIGPVILTSEN
jgi:hypothetical protein